EPRRRLDRICAGQCHGVGPLSPSPIYSYHRETIAHLGLDGPRPSEAALALLDERERTCGVSFPAAVREWFALEAGLVERGLYSKGYLLPLEGLGDPCVSWTADMEAHPLDLVVEGRLPVLIGEYGEDLWAVDLNGSDDPSVSVMHDFSVRS